MIVDGDALKKEIDLIFEKGWFDAGTHHYILGKILSCSLDARIEAAIREFEKQAQKYAPSRGSEIAQDKADLVRWVETGEKDQDTYTDKDFGL